MLSNRLGKRHALPRRHPPVYYGLKRGAAYRHDTPLALESLAWRRHAALAPLSTLYWVASGSRKRSLGALFRELGTSG